MNTPRQDNDTAGLSGWLYTDLLLGLAVVFLGTVSFVIPSKADKPPENGGTATTTTTTTVPSRVETIFFKTPLIGTYDLSGIDLLEKAIQEFITDKKLDGNPRVALAIVYGRYQTGEPEGQGSERASYAYSRLQEQLPRIFNDNVVVRKIGNRSLSSDSQFKIELFFTYERAIELP